jgi:hypothetical protein
MNILCKQEYVESKWLIFRKPKGSIFNNLSAIQCFFMILNFKSINYDKMIKCDAGSNLGFLYEQK